MKPILALILTKQGTLQDGLLAQCFDDGDRDMTGLDPAHLSTLTIQ